MNRNTPQVNSFIDLEVRRNLWFASVLWKGTPKREQSRLLLDRELYGMLKNNSPLSYFLKGE